METIVAAFKLAKKIYIETAAKSMWNRIIENWQPLKDQIYLIHKGCGFLAFLLKQNTEEQ